MTKQLKIAKKIGRHILNMAVKAPKNIILRTMGVPLKPRWVVYMVTDRCNSRCVHCNIWRHKPMKDPLSPEQVEKFFSDKVFKNVEYVICTGGEATVRNDLEEIMLSLHRALPRATLQLSTNALLPERIIKVVNSAMENNIKLDIGVSLDGIGEEHDLIRGIKGNFEKVDWLLHRLVEIRIAHKDKLSVSVGIVISERIINSVSKVREYVRKLKIGLVEAWYNTSSFYDNYDRKNNLKMKERLIDVVNGQPPTFLREKWLQWLKGDPIKFPCFALNTFCVVKCNGIIAPCLNLWNLEAGNARDSSPTEVWYGSEAKQIRKKIKKCDGCLNNWGVSWSFVSAYYPLLFYYLRHLILRSKSRFLSGAKASHSEVKKIIK